MDGEFVVDLHGSLFLREDRFQVEGVGEAVRRIDAHDQFR